MNAKKCKALRKVCKGSFPDNPPVVSLNRNGITNPIFYPEGSLRRVYQDGKKVLK